MTAEIKSNLENPLQLERLYRDNRSAFRREFNRIYPEIQQAPAAQIWNARINFESEDISWGSGREFTIILAACFIAGLIAKIPDFVAIDPDYFFPRNIGFVVLPLLAGYFAWKHKIPTNSILLASVAFVISAVYINLLPGKIDQSDTLTLACIHLPLFLWAVLGFVFVGDKWKSNPKRLDFLRYNADLVVMAAVIGIAGMLLTAVTFGLFRLINIDIEHYFQHYFAPWAAPAVPIIATYLVRTNPQLVSKVSPIIARVFTPLVLVTLVIYLTALISTGKDPYNDREFLLIFNALLIGVMALILFSIAETSKNAGSKMGIVLLLALSTVTIIVNGIALSAIVFRISEWGITPNRLAVLGGNALILTNLLIVAYRLFKTVKNSNEIEKVENSIASFLPIYSIWTIFMVFVVPVLFGFK